MRDHHVWLHDHPPQSPNLNLIENFWVHLKRRVYELDPELKISTESRPTRKLRIRRAVERAVDEWNNNPEWSLPGKLTASMHKRLTAVQHAEGYQTKY